ncbi:MAG: hypothetical protein Kow00120_03300 [Anaerolineae bacterium]
MTIYALATRITTRRTPIDPGTRFAPSFTCIYVFFEHRAIDWGLSWTAVLYRDGALIGAESRRWSSERDGWGFYFFCRPEGGYVAGDYEIQFFLADTLAARARFVVREDT